MQEDGGAVGGEGRQHQAGSIGHKGIALRLYLPKKPLAPVGCIHSPDDVRVGLPGEYQIFDIKSQDFPQNFVVFHHIFRIISPVDAQIQAGQAAFADPAEAGGKAVGHGDALGSKIF